MTTGGATTPELVDALTRLAAGDFDVRLPRNYQRDEQDALASLVNLVAEEVGRLMREREGARQALEASVLTLTESFVRLAAGDFRARVDRSGQGDPLDVLAYLFNNTVEEMGDAFRRLEEQRTIQDAILESMVDGLLLLDRTGTVIRSNGAMASLLGLGRADLEGFPIERLLAPASRPAARSILEAGDREPLRGQEILFSDRSGDPVPLAVSASPCRGPDGGRVGTVVVARDERLLKRARGEKMTERLAAMGMVAAGVAHEINNPLTYVMANLEMALGDVEKLLRPGGPSLERVSEMDGALRSALTGAKRVRDIVRDFKTFSTVDRERLVAVDLNAVVDAAVTLVRNQLQHHARLEVIRGTPPSVIGNPARLGQVVMNLLLNAAQAIPEGSAQANLVRVVTGHTETGDALIEVVDTGTGIAPEHLPHIFDAFFTTKPIGAATGIGLFICHQIVSTLGGRIDVHSAQGEGTTFRVTLPRLERIADQEDVPVVGQGAPVREEIVEAGPAGTPEVAGGAGRPGHGRGDPGAGAPRRRLLVVDDVPEVGRSVQRMLSREHDVALAVRGDHALELIAKQPFDLVICDLMMPEIAGPELHARLSQRHPDLARSMIFITGGAFTDGAAEFLGRVPNQRLAKPFSAAELWAAVARSLGGMGAPGAGREPET